MKTLNEILATIETFNNAAVQSVDFAKWGTVVKFSATLFAFEGIKAELGIKIEQLQGGTFMFVTTAPHVA